MWQPSRPVVHTSVSVMLLLVLYALAHINTARDYARPSRPFTVALRQGVGYGGRGVRRYLAFSCFYGHAPFADWWLSWHQNWDDGLLLRYKLKLLYRILLFSFAIPLYIVQRQLYSVRVAVSMYKIIKPIYMLRVCWCL